MNIIQNHECTIRIGGVGMIKKSIVLLLCIFMVLGSSVSTYAASVDDRLANYKVDYEGQIPRIMKLKSSDQNEQLRTLQDLKILQGTGNSLDLDKGLTRAQGAIVYLRLIGGPYFASEFSKENTNYKTEFIYIPEWAMYDINYLYKSGLINGINHKEFGANDLMTAEQFTTLVLRGLGYEDAEGEFVWNQSLNKAVEIGMLTQAEKTEIEKDKYFTREEMAKIAYNALFIRIKNEPKLLISKSVLNRNFGSFAQMFYIELNNEEVEEFTKAKTEKGYSVFPNDPKKRQEIMSKINAYFDICNEYYRFYLNDEVLKIEVISVDDAGNSKFSEHVDSYSNYIWTTTRMDTPTIGLIETGVYHPWTLEGNKFSIGSDTNYFGMFYHQLILEYMKTRVDNLIHSEERLGKGFNLGGVENFTNKYEIDGRYDKLDRDIFSYDGVKITDSISIQRSGSLDYHMYIDLLK